jgi:type II secretory pathway pseudopilin PulG
MKIRGFTFLEILLVIVITVSIMLLFIRFMTKKSEEARINKMVMTAQQILSANLAYHQNNGRWADCSMATNDCDLMENADIPILEQGYLPNQSYYTLWPQSDIDYIQFSRPTDKKFTICIPIYAGAATQGIAENLAGRLPLGRTSQTDNATAECSETIDPTPCEDEKLPCRVLTTINEPGKNLNNSRSFNFAGVYHNGACVPTPVCPSNMKPNILVYPTSVSGLYEGMNGSGSTTGDVVPLSSFTASAIGPEKWDKASGLMGPANCTGAPNPECYDSKGGNYLDPGMYWRICLQVITGKGNVANGSWVKESGTIMAITRCVPTNEPESSGWTLFDAF